MFHEGQVDEAYSIIKEALAKDIKNSACKHCFLGWQVYSIINRHFGNYEEAIKCLKMAMKLGHPEVLLNLKDLASCQLQIRKLDDAVFTRINILQSAPEYSFNWVSFCILLSRIKRRKELESVLKVVMTELFTPVDNLLYSADGFMFIIKNLSIDDELMEYINHAFRRKELKSSIALLEQPIITSTITSQALFHSNDLDIFENILTMCLFRLPILTKVCADFVSYEKGGTFSTLKFDHLWKFLYALYFSRSKPDVLNVLRYVFEGFEDKTMFLLNVVKERIHSFDYTLFKQSIEQWQIKKSAKKHILAFSFPESLNFEKEDFDGSDNCSDLLIFHARILKKQNRIEEAIIDLKNASIAEPGDRYIRFKIVKYLFRSLRFAEAFEEIRFMLCKPVNMSINDLLNELVLIQAAALLIEAARCYKRMRQFEKALPIYEMVFDVNNTFLNDQFDFHQYAIRRRSINTYDELIEFEDHISECKIFNAAVREYLSCYLAFLVTTSQSPSFESMNNKVSSDSIISTALSIISSNTKNQDDYVLALRVFLFYGKSCLAFKTLRTILMMSNDQLLKGVLFEIFPTIENFNEQTNFSVHKEQTFLSHNACETLTQKLLEIQNARLEKCSNYKEKFEVQLMINDLTNPL